MMPIQQTMQAGMVGSMPPKATRPDSMTETKLTDLTKTQLIALCELRGVDKVSRYQSKGYYVKRLMGLDNPSAVKNKAVRLKVAELTLTDDERVRLFPSDDED